MTLNSKEQELLNQTQGSQDKASKPSTSRRKAKSAQENAETHAAIAKSNASTAMSLNQGVANLAVTQADKAAMTYMQVFTDRFHQNMGAIQNHQVKLMASMAELENVSLITTDDLLAEHPPVAFLDETAFQVQLAATRVAGLLGDATGHAR